MSGAPRVAYVMSRWPKVSETFILNEVLQLRRYGVDVSLYPLLRERQAVTHREAAMLTPEATFVPFISPALVGSILHYLVHAPRRLLKVLWIVLRGTVTSLNFFVGALGILPKAIHLARLMQQRGVDHVHCHFATHPAVAGLIVHRLTGIPFSFTAHGSDLHVDQTMLGSKVAEAAFVATVSEYNRQMIRAASDTVHHDKVHVIHCGVDLNRFRATRPPTGIDPMRVVCVGSLEEVKGQRHLVEVIARLRDAGVAVDCRLVGGGRDRRALKLQIDRLGLGDHVHLLGPQPTHRVVAEMEAADVLVAPSVPTAGGKREGIPVVLIEAMAMERAVVASRLSGIPELVDDEKSGLLVAAGDEDGLAAALLRLASDPGLRTKLGRAGRRTVASQFSLEDNARRLLDLIIGSRGQP